MLYYFEKAWNVANHKAISTNFSAMEQSAKAELNLLLHSPCSPTETLMDYHVNRPLKNWLANWVFEGVGDLMADVKAWIASNIGTSSPVEFD
ncbi:unnamed protein product [Haemonchus placei]|uniref:Transposase n=1 Tax=Haemonchus placei TaxID=6290 RepID=A0A0N4W7K5_HAEPC|nr:unnamed protein product [Haemonchus placei]